MKRLLRAITYPVRRVHLLLLWLTVTMGTTFAAQAGGALPWQSPLQKIQASISGPVAKTLAVIVIVIAGLGVAFGESGSGTRRIMQIVFGLAIAFGAATIVASLYGPSGGVAF